LGCSKVNGIKVYADDEVSKRSIPAPDFADAQSKYDPGGQTTNGNSGLEKDFIVTGIVLAKCRDVEGNVLFH
jgi:hypothetical protein